MFKTAKNTKQQGNVGLGLAMAYYVSHMFTVSVPLNDSQDYDLIVDKDGVLYKVQVKTCGYKVGKNYAVMMSMQGGNRKKNYVGRLGIDFKYDILFAVTADGMMYEIPRQKIAHIRRRLHLPGSYGDCLVKPMSV